MVEKDGECLQRRKEIYNLEQNFCNLDSTILIHELIVVTHNSFRISKLLVNGPPHKQPVCVNDQNLLSITPRYLLEGSMT